MGTTKVKALQWWLYATYTFVLWLFLAPTLISIADTFLVLVGVALMVLWGVWSWSLWVKDLIEEIT